MIAEVLTSIPISLVAVELLFRLPFKDVVHEMGRRMNDSASAFRSKDLSDDEKQKLLMANSLSILKVNCKLLLLLGIFSIGVLIPWTVIQNFITPDLSKSSLLVATTVLSMVYAVVRKSLG